MITGVFEESVYKRPKLTSTKTTEVDKEYVGFVHGHVPTFLSECPECGTSHKWRTTGYIPFLKCEKCKTQFNAW